MPDQSLKILQVLRAPVGGLFRHVADLSSALASRGHAVGIVADASTGGETATAALEALQPQCSFGISRIKMARQISPSDVRAVRHVAQLIDKAAIDVVHGHGAKGGAYARLATKFAKRKPRVVYTPHGGSLHYDRRSPVGYAFLTLEAYLASLTDVIIFESAYGQRVYSQKVGRRPATSIVAHNGLREDEFDPAETSGADSDLLFIGELRDIKGVDVLLKALGGISDADGNPATLIVVGDGPQEDEFKALSSSLGLDGRVDFVGRANGRDYFSRARVLVVPSRAESLPYVVLEAAAAALPLVATNVGGISEILGDQANLLVAAEDVDALSDAIRAKLNNADETRRQAAALRERIKQHFHIETMVDAIENQYTVSN